MSDIPTDAAAATADSVESTVPVVTPASTRSTNEIPVQLDSIALFGAESSMIKKNVEEELNPADEESEATKQKKELDNKALFADADVAAAPAADDVKVLGTSDKTTTPQIVAPVEEPEPVEVKKNVLNSISARTQAGKQYFLKDVEFTTTVLQLKELVVKQEGNLSVNAVRLIHRGKPLSVSHYV